MAERYDDLKGYREGRLNSMVVRTWRAEFRDLFLAELAANFNTLFTKDTPKAAAHILNELSGWLLSDTGKRFIRKAFDLNESTDLSDDFFIPFWNDRVVSNNGFEGLVLYKGTLNHEDWLVLHEGKAGVNAMVADTFIGWLNSHVGRSFVSRAYRIDIPLAAPDGSE